MFKAARWRSEKNKIKAVFKLQFQATQVPQVGWETLQVSLIPLDVGTPVVRSEKVAVINGTCRWLNPIYESVKLVRDPKTGKINEKIYQFLVSATGSNQPGVLGEASINLADYAEVFKSSSIIVPLKASNSGALLHVTIKRMQGDGEGREAAENGDTITKPQRRTLQSHLSKCDDEEVTKAVDGVISTEDSSVNNNIRTKFPSSRTLPLHVETNGNLWKSHSFDAISATASDISSGRYIARESGIMHNDSHQEISRLLSPLSNSGTPKMLLTSSGDWSGISALDESTDGSTNNSGEAGPQVGLQDSDDDTIEKLRGDIIALTRKQEVSDLELQTLKKQIVKETRRGQDLLQEISSLKEEKDALKRECEQLKSAEKCANDNVSNKLLPDGNEVQSMLEELKRELYHEKNLNANLRIQLQKTQESNSELLLAVRDLDEQLEHKNKEMSHIRCSSTYSKVGPEEEFKDMDYGSRLSHMQNSECEPELLEKNSQRDKEQNVVDVLVGDMKVPLEQQKKIKELNNEIELFKKDHEELEMQMEQLALDYEILTQENHDISSKLEQTQLREQLRMQYECSAHLAIISDLEDHVDNLEKELQKQAEAFEADLASITCAKVEQEQRAVKAEEELRKARWKNVNAAEQLHDEFKKLSLHMSSTFHANEKLLMQSITEASELRMQKIQLEELLEKAEEELSSVQSQYRTKFQQLLSLVDFKSKETERLLLELKNKNEELQKQKMFGEEKLKNFSEEMLLLKTEIEKLTRERDDLSEQNKRKEKVLNQMEQLKTSNSVSDKALQEKCTKIDMLEKEVASLTEQVGKSIEELNDLRNLKDEKENIGRMLKSDVEMLNVQYSDLKCSLSENELEKENIIKEVLKLRDELHRKEDVISILERNIRNSANTITNNLSNEKDLYNKDEEKENGTEESNQSSSCVSEGIVQKGDENFNMNFKYDTADADSRQNSLLSTRTEDKTCNHDVNGSGGELPRRNSEADLKKEEEALSCTSDQRNEAKIIREIALLKEQNTSMEAELKEMQERYSEISLKFAEVEGERQQLVMTIRTLKNSLKS
ncbi:uncharacterized protein [Typha latifolia]|uniref:uncharacterized protein n=1 Tax=Typha latifolia TaxID=4733 RepID=UPI003C2B2EDD